MGRDSKKRKILIVHLADCEILQGFSVDGEYEKKGVLLTIKGERQVVVKDKDVEWLGEIGI